jgi:hypothetical protein
MSSRPQGARPRSWGGEKRWPLRSSRQCDRGLVAVLGLAADEADRLVEQDGDLLLLLALGGGVHGDAHIRRHLHAHAGHLAIYAHPAALDPGIGLAAGAQAQLGHALVQARGGHGTRGGAG